MIVLDASAVLALVHGETGADVVAAALPGSTLSTANLAEVIGKLVDVGVDTRPVVGLLRSAGVHVEPLTAADAELAGALRGLPGGTRLSLGDRCCLALALRSGGAVLTADRSWAKLDVSIEIRLLR